MHSAALASSARPAAISCLRLPLRPFSIGHSLLLTRAENPLVTYGPESLLELPQAAQNDALKSAVDVCSQTWAENLFVPQTRWQVWRYTRVCKRWALEMERIPAAFWPVEIAKFQTYLADGSQELPTVKMPRTGSAPFHYFGAPEEGRLLNYVEHFHPLLCREYGSPFDFPLGLAKMLCLTHLESNGEAWVKNYWDFQAELKAKAYDEAHPDNTLAITREERQAAAIAWNREHPEHPVPLEY